MILKKAFKRVFFAGFKAGLKSCKDSDPKGYHDKDEKDVVAAYENMFSSHRNDSMADEWTSWAVEHVKVSCCL